MTYRTRSATRADYEKLAGEPPAFSFHALVCEKKEDGTLLGMGGVMWMPGNVEGWWRAYAFLEVADYVTEHLTRRTVTRVLLREWKNLRTRHPVLYANPDPRYPGAARFLEHLGFKRIGEVNGTEVYLWQA